VTSTGVTVDVDRINCNSTGTGPGDKPCSVFYDDFQRLLDSQPGTPVYWGTGTQACGYGTCYAKYILDDDFLAQLQLTAEPYTNQRVDWIDAAPSGTGAITADELHRYRDKVQGAPNGPAPENYVNSVLDPDNWWAPTDTPGEDGGVRTDWSMPDCVALWWPDCQSSINAAATAAHARSLPAITVSPVSEAAADLSMFPGAVLAQSPTPFSTGRFTSITLTVNPDPLNGFTGGGGYAGGGDATPFGGDCDFPHFTGATWEGMIAAHPGSESFYADACLEAWNIFDNAGGLSEGVIANARVLIRGDELENPQVIQALTANGTRIQDWAKVSTRDVYGGHSQASSRCTSTSTCPTAKST
jgi:hypothetical protein